VSDTHKHWSAHQLAEFLALVSSCPDPASAVQVATERAAETLEAEVAALIRGDSVEASVGFRAGQAPERELVGAAAGTNPLSIPGLGRVQTASVSLDDEDSSWLLLGRLGKDGFQPEEIGLLRGMARVLSMTLRILGSLESERALRAQGDRERADRERADARYRTLVEKLPAIVYTSEVGEQGAWRYVSPQILSILGFSPQEWLADAQLWAGRLHPDDRDRVLDEERKALAGAVSTGPSDYRMIARDGRVIWFMDDAVMVQQEHGPWYWHGVLYDITDRKRVEAELKLRAAQQAAVARLGEQALEGTDLPALMERAVCAAAELLDVEYAGVFELRAEEEVFTLQASTGLKGESTGSLTIPATPHFHAGFALVQRRPVIVEDWSLEQRFEKHQPVRDLDAQSGIAVIVDGSERPFGIFELQSCRFRVFTKEDINFVQSLVNVLADAIERRVTEEEIRHQAVHDPLTSLPNRVLFLDRLAHALVQSRRRRAKVAVLFLDIDQFKLVNDSLGHAAGDELLIAVGLRLRDALRAGDTVARFGGDEFGLLIEDLEHERDAIAVAEHLAGRFARPVVLRGVDHFVTASIGIAVAPEGTEKPQALLRDADAAMYRAKARGQGRYELFDQAMRARAMERLQLENDLRRAVVNGELRLYYQPVVSLNTGATVGFEALLRWQHPGRGLILPGEFIAVAEESGLIDSIGRWVLEDACRQAVDWQRRNPDAAPVGISVNLSARQLAQRDLTAVVAEVLRSSGIDPASLSLEITESTLIEDSEGAEVLTTLQSMGVRLVIDDFGTGYSSLGYLKRFPVDSLKVDRSFVEGLGVEPESAVIVNAIVAMAGALSLDVIAEGVETSRQLGELRRLGCSYAQGFHFAQPAPAAELEYLFARRFPWLDRLDSHPPARLAS
jgi:diguanylate cyclase (GGDEF)-like protein/PAS domain S-box-containing protein